MSNIKANVHTCERIEFYFHPILLQTIKMPMMLINASN